MPDAPAPTASAAPGQAWPDDMRIAVLVPCYNEAATIGNVVRAFKAQLPGAAVHVYDNNSADNTVDEARAAGALIGREHRQGKGNVVRRMFSDIEADIYVLVDGDMTYDPGSAPGLVARLYADNLDMVNGARRSVAEEAYRAGHRFGNWMLTTIVSQIFGTRFKDMLSGYRVFSRRFVKSFPAASTGFEIETELTVHALDLDLPTAEVDTSYGARPEGSQSKLNSIPDGVRILWKIFRLLKSERPFQLFAGLGLLALLISFGAMAPILREFLLTGQVTRIPTVVVSAALALGAIVAVFSGAILDTVTQGRREAKRLAYLSFPAPRQPR